MLLERSPAWHWRAGGVFASPAAVAELRSLGVPEATLAAVARPIPAMRVETPAGTAFELTYGAETGGEPAVGFDRSALDPALLDLARAAGRGRPDRDDGALGRAVRPPARDGDPAGIRRRGAGARGSWSAPTARDRWSPSRRAWTVRRGSATGSA